MANRPSRLQVSIPLASADGRFYGRWPQGNAPLGAIVGAALSSSAAGGTLTSAVTGSFAVESGVLTFNAGNANNYEFVLRWDPAYQNGDGSVYAAPKTHRLKVGTSAGASDIIAPVDLSTTAMQGAVIVKVRGLPGTGPYHCAVTSIAAPGSLGTTVESAYSSDYAITATAPLSYDTTGFTPITSLPTTISGAGNYVLSSALSLSSGDCITVSATAGSVRILGAGGSLTFGTSGNGSGIKVTGEPDFLEIYGLTFTKGSSSANTGAPAILFTHNQNTAGKKVRIHNNTSTRYSTQLYYDLFLSGYPGQNGGPGPSGLADLANVLCYNNTDAMSSTLVSTTAYSGPAYTTTDCGFFGNCRNAAIVGNNVTFTSVNHYNGFGNRAAWIGTVALGNTYTVSAAVSADYASNNMRQQGVNFAQASEGGSSRTSDGTLLLDGYQSWIANNAISYGQQAADTRCFGFDGSNLIRVVWNKVTATGGCVNGDGLRIFSARNKSASISWGFNEFDGTGAAGNTIGCRYGSNMNNSTDTTWYPQSGYYYSNNIHDCAVPWETYDGTAGYINVWRNTFKANGSSPCILPPGQQFEGWNGYWNSNTLTGSEPKVNSTHDTTYGSFNSGTDIQVYASFVLTDLSDQTNPYFHFNSSWGGYDANSYTPSPPSNLRAI